MKVLVTGGTGHVGKAVVDLLLSQGDTIRIIGRHETADSGEAEYRQCDITDVESLLDCARGMEGIIHLAGIPSPGHCPASALFTTNGTGTFNIYEAAEQLGISRVVTASSINAMGNLYGIVPPVMPYFPLDEKSPSFTSDPYSFSKETVESIGRYYHRRGSVSGASLRIPWVYNASEEGIIRESPALYKTAWENLLSLAPEERKEIIQRDIEDFNRYRKDRYTGRSPVYSYSKQLEIWNPLLRWRTDFYAVIDERDCAQAFSRALKADYSGFHPLFVNDSHNATGLNTKDLTELVYPIPGEWSGKWKREISGTESLVSIEKARTLIGFEPEYSVDRFFETR